MLSVAFGQGLLAERGPCCCPSPPRGWLWAALPGAQEEGQ